MSERPWLYFGCHGDYGHYLWDGRGNKVREYDHPLSKFDGKLCFRATRERVAALTRLCAFGYSALAFWDYSVDSRGGSNSIIFAPSLNITAAEMVEGARKHLPLYAKRWPSIDISRAEYRPPSPAPETRDDTRDGGVS